MKVLTLQTLKDARGCTEQVELFEHMFGQQVDVTVELALSVYDKFDWYWAASSLLTASARAEYDKARVSAWAEYDKITASARAEYCKVIYSARAEYDKITDSAWAECRKARASAWATAFINQD